MFQKSVFQVLHKANKNSSCFYLGMGTKIAITWLLKWLSRKFGTICKILFAFSVFNFFLFISKMKIISYFLGTLGDILLKICRESPWYSIQHPRGYMAEKLQIGLYIVCLVQSHKQVFTLLNVNLNVQMLTLKSVIHFASLFPAPSCIFMVCSAKL